MHVAAMVGWMQVLASAPRDGGVADSSLALVTCHNTHQGVCAGFDVSVLGARARRSWRA